jgi:hypothetical protein
LAFGCIGVGHRCGCDFVFGGCYGVYLCVVVGDCWVFEEVVSRQTIWILRGLEKFSLVPLLRMVDTGALPLYHAVDFKIFRTNFLKKGFI